MSGGVVQILPSVNASLNALAAVLLAIGYWKITHGQVRGHRNAMLACFGVSVVFLACYLTYHYLTGSRTFAGPSGTGWIYYPILISHVILAAAVPFLALRTIYLAWRRQFEKHRRLARWTFPIWMYVSVTGVLVYFFLYHWFPAHA
jgi:uncharacterized membrane protein YozB (DUF420 family)